jgi:ABC-type phosphate/phosphonate transport system substrate-binding protein
MLAVVPVVAPARSARSDSAAAAEQPPVYYSQLYVRSDSAYLTFEELRGSTFAFNDETSLSGYYCMKFFLLAYNDMMKLNMSPFFSKAIRTGAHVNSIDAVLQGRAEVLALDCNVLEALQGDAAGREKLRGLRAISVPPLQRSLAATAAAASAGSYRVSSDGLLGPHPTQPLVVSRRLSADLVAAITAALLCVPSDAMGGIRSQRYVAVDASYYDGITAMIGACEGVNLLAAAIEDI